MMLVLVKLVRFCQQQQQRGLVVVDDDVLCVVFVWWKWRELSLGGKVWILNFGA
jgi:hypothetical protein